MAIIKHIAIKNSNYDAATDYLTFKHDEFTNKPILDDNGNMIPREEFLIEGINCDPFTFGRECEATNAHFNKNQTKDEIKAHHYIISFDPRDRDENNLTLESAKAMAVSFAKKNFPGHQTIICAHPDGHNSAGNIHVHIVINSLRKLDVTPSELSDFAYTPERTGDTLAGHKHHVTKPFLEYLKQETMTMCQENSLYQVDLLSPAHVRITDREYWAKRKGQAKLDAENKEKIENGVAPEDITNKVYKTDKEFLRDAINSILNSIDLSNIYKPTDSYQTFCDKLYETYGIIVHESRGKIGYIHPDHTRPTRGRQLGADFEKEYILEALALKLSQAKQRGQKYHSSGIQLIADLEANIKARQNIYYARKVKITNLQQMSKTLSFLKEQGIDSVETLDAIFASTKADVTEKHSLLKATELDLKNTNLLIKNTGQYLANKDIYRQYMKAKNKAKFREEHISEITLYEAARKYLKDAGYLQKPSDPTEKVPIFIPNIKELKAHKQALVESKNQQYEEYSFARAKYRELQTVHQNVHSILDHNKQQSKIQTREKASNTKQPEQS